VNVLVVWALQAGLGNTSVVEMGWCLMTLACLWYSVGCTTDCWHDVRAAEVPPLDLVGWWIAAGLFRTELVNVLAQSSFMAIGLLSALAPSRPDVPADPMALLTAIAAPILLVLAQVAFTWDARQRRRDRRRINTALRKEYATGRGMPVMPGGKRAYDPPAAVESAP
jgi:hypothetical protein